MKSIIALAFLAASLNVVADTLPVPEYLRDGVIVVTTRDGRQHKFSSNEYAVVKREVHEKPAVVCCLPSKREVSVADSKDNRITVHGGIGPTGLSATRQPGVATVTQDRGFIFGGSYSRKISDRYSLTGTYLSNDSVTLGIGLDF